MENDQKQSVELFEKIKIWVQMHKKWSASIVALFLLILDLFIPSKIGTLAIENYLSWLAFGIIIFVLLARFWEFYSGTARLQHDFTSFHGATFLRGFYRIYFPAVIGSLVVLVVVALALLPADGGGWGILDQPTISPSGSIVTIVQTISIIIIIFVLSDLEIRKNDLLFSPKSKTRSFQKGLLYIIPLLGLYFGIITISRFLIEINFGRGSLIPTSFDFYSFDSGLIQPARFWIFLSSIEKRLVLISFIGLFVAIEYFLRGYLGNEARRTGLGPAGLVFVPAIIQGFAFSSANLIFIDPIYYWFTLFKAFFLGVILGIILWRTGRFSITLIAALLARALDNTLDFYVTLLNMLPEILGEYNPNDQLVTQADQVGFFLIYAQIAMIILAPFIIILSYSETATVLTQLYQGLKKQWFGYFILGFAFFMIDLIFSYISSTGIFSPVVGFIVALIVMMFVITYLFKLLPPPSKVDFLKLSEQFDSTFPLDLNADIKYLEAPRHWYEKSKIVGLLSGLIFLYILFITASYRQLTIFNPELKEADVTLFEDLTYIIFLILLPTILIGISGYFMSNSITKGYYFRDNWRKTLYVLVLGIYIINLYNWSVSGSLAEFSWRNLPFFVVFAVFIFPKPIREPVEDFRQGFSRDGRIATFRRISDKPEVFIEVYDDLLELEIDVVQVGAKISAANLGILMEKEEIASLRNESTSIGSKIGSLMALGIMGSVSSEGLLLQQIQNENINVKVAAFWALGKIGTPRSLQRMSQILEENPLKILIKVAENAILTIDPQYPLAGLRDHLILD